MDGIVLVIILASRSPEAQSQRRELLRQIPHHFRGSLQTLNPDACQGVALEFG